MNILILCGGVSPEHAVSVVSARSIVNAMDPTAYRIKIVAIDLHGHFRDLDRLDGMEVCTPHSGRPTSLKRENNRVFLECGWPVDLIFPVLHGPGGEDGSIQGLCEMLEVPYVGNPIKASALAMDKVASKILFQVHGLPVVPFKVLNKEDPLPNYDVLAKDLGSEILFVKPSCLGSSVGASPMMRSNYREKIAASFFYGPQILIEKSISGVEYECAILGNDRPKASGVGEIVVSGGGFYSYDIKYINSHKATISTRANLSDEKIAQIQAWSLKAFRALGCSGLARVDFLANHEGIFINEVNTMPGFTSMSLYPSLWVEQGLAYKDLIHELITLALSAFQEKRSYKANLERLEALDSFAHEEGIDKNNKKNLL